MVEFKRKHRKINSLVNERIKNAVRLRRHTADGQIEAGGSLTDGPKTHETVFIEGVRVLWVAIETHVAFGDVYYTEKFLSKSGSSDLLDSLYRLGADIFEVPDAVMNKLSGTKAPQGICALASMPILNLENLGRGASGDRFVVCDGVKDSGNMGAIIRSSDAFGASALVCLTGTCNPFSSKVVRSSAGSVFRLPVVRTERDNLIGWLKKHGIPVVVATPRNGRPLYAVDLAGAFALVLGEEAGGVSGYMAENAAIFVSIPMDGGIDSLNVAITASICLYESGRQRLVPSCSLEE